MERRSPERAHVSQWAIRTCRALLGVMTAADLQASFFFQGTTATSHCSGMLAAEQAILALVAASAIVFGIPTSLQTVGVCEIEPKCYPSWHGLLSSAVHGFSDIADLIHHPIAPQSMGLHGEPFHNQCKESFSLRLSESAWRGRHGRRCPVPDHVALDFTGTPCQDWSRMNKQGLCVILATP